jgi:DNA ligase 1
VKYAELAAFFERLEGESGRLGMTGILVELLERVPKTDMVPVVRLLQGAVAPDWEGLEVGLAEKQIVKALALATGGDVEALTKLYQAKGDLGLAAEAALGTGKGRKQATLFGGQALTVKGVFGTLVEIAHTVGTGSQEGKQRLLSKLLLDASALEARYITRTVSGRLRLGVADMTFLDALASWHMGKGVRSVTEMEPEERAAIEDVRRRLERAYDLQSDLAVVAATLATDGMKGIDRLDIVPGVPVRPMAAERLKTMPEILERMEGRVSLEYKYDGLRIQAHVPSKGEVRLFSRRLENLTAQFPDVVANVRAQMKGKDCIVEGEAIAFDADGRMRPFQDISRRRGRKAGIEAMAKEMPVTLVLFDCIAQAGHSVMEEPLAERRRRLEKLVPAKDGLVRLSIQETVTSVEGIEEFFHRALEDGAEGIMCKDPRAPYKAGSRGFAWVKFKADYQEGMADSMDLVAVGAFLGRGRRAGWYGALLMAAYDPEREVYQSVCKLGTGFSDEVLQGLKARFKDVVSPKQPVRVESGLEPDVWFDPNLVMEVEAAELTLSPTHRAGWGMVKPDAGFAARFPRFTGRWRDDKAPDQATTVEELAEMYRMKAGERTREHARSAA